MNNSTQTGRALQQLNISYIGNYSQQFIGGSEQMFEILKNRLPKELTIVRY